MANTTLCMCVRVREIKSCRLFTALYEIPGIHQEMQPKSYGLCELRLQEFGSSVCFGRMKPSIQQTETLGQYKESDLPVL